MAQWETRRDGTGRWDDLTRKAHGRERDLNVQLENILYELTEISWISGILESFGGMNSLKKMDIYQAVVTFEQTIEQAGKPSFPERFAFANSIYRSLASNVGE
ncbi:hypothetical protein AAHB57_28270 [Bacillus cereus]